jgi:hypothetical protein
MTRLMATSDSKWTAVTVPKSGEFQTLYKRLEAILRRESAIPIAGKIPVHAVCTVAMRHMLEAKDPKGR